MFKDTYSKYFNKIKQFINFDNITRYMNVYYIYQIEEYIHYEHDTTAGAKLTAGATEPAGASQHHLQHSIS